MRLPYQNSICISFRLHSVYIPGPWQVFYFHCIDNIILGGSLHILVYIYVYRYIYKYIYIYMHTYDYYLLNIIILVTEKSHSPFIQFVK
jgi:hypothetical protein